MGGRYTTDAYGQALFDGLQDLALNSSQAERLLGHPSPGVDVDFIEIRGFSVDFMQFFMDFMRFLIDF